MSIHYVIVLAALFVGVFSYAAHQHDTEFARRLNFVIGEKFPDPRSEPGSNMNFDSALRQNYNTEVPTETLILCGKLISLIKKRESEGHPITDFQLLNWCYRAEYVISIHDGKPVTSALSGKPFSERYEHNFKDEVEFFDSEYKKIKDWIQKTIASDSRR